MAGRLVNALPDVQETMCSRDAATVLHVENKHSPLM